MTEVVETQPEGDELDVAMECLRKRDIQTMEKETVFHLLFLQQLHVPSSTDSSVMFVIMASVVIVAAAVVVKVRKTKMFITIMSRLHSLKRISGTWTGTNLM